jgi:hypothetical protein
VASQYLLPVRISGCLFVVAMLSASGVGAQSSTSLGLASVGAFGVYGAGAWIEHGFKAAEIGGHLDLGHLRSKQVRITADVAFLRTWPHREYVVSEDITYRDVFYDLSGHAAVTLLGRAGQSRVVPYVSTGVGVHVLTSSFGTLAIDRRYNTNSFGLMGATGLRLRTGTRSPFAVLAEVRRTQARDVSRTSLHLGVLALFGTLR